MSNCDIPRLKKLPFGLPLNERLSLLLHPERNPTGYEPFDCAPQHPFQPEAATWSRVNAWWLIDASWLAYSHDAEVIADVFRDRANLPNCRSISRGGTQLFVADSSTLAIVVFRGTQPDDWADLFDIARYRVTEWDAGFVRRGFVDAFEAISRALGEILDALPTDCRVWFTGHSLGAALACLAAYRFRSRTTGVYTFASPRIGNGTFVALFDAAMLNASIRYVNDHDVVTHVPPELFAVPHGKYGHVEELRWINENGQVGITTPTLRHFVKDVFGTPNTLLDIVRLLDSGVQLDPPDALLDHTPLFYAIHCWNDYVQHLTP